MTTTLCALRFISLIALTCGTVLLSESSNAQGNASRLTPRYRVINLGDIQAYAINDRGDVVGAAFRRRAKARAVIWRQGHLLSLPQSASEECVATGINDRGQVVGMMRDRRGRHAVIWRSRVRSVLKTSANASVAWGINSHGHVAGAVYGEGGIAHAAIWRNGPAEVLRGIPPQSEALAVNDQGQVFGRSGSVMYRPFLWLGGRRLSFSGLPRHSNFELQDNNNGGDIVGSAVYTGGRVAGSTAHLIGFLWRSGRLRVLPNATGMRPTGINDRGEIVGEFRSTDRSKKERRRACWYFRGRVMNLRAHKVVVIRASSVALPTTQGRGPHSSHVSTWEQPSVWHCS